MSGIVPRGEFFKEEKPPEKCPHCSMLYALKYDRYEKKRSVFVCKECKKETIVCCLPPHDLI